MKNKNFEQETSRMVELMKYGMNESVSKSSSPRVEYSVKGADGLTYGIVNEGTKFYIKVAPKKDTKILAEDFDYIGGEMNKKENEYHSYSAASKNLELKLMQINESHKATKVNVETFKKEPAAEWQINETKEMRSEIDRMNQISKNVAHILTEGSIPSEHTLPEAPAKNPSQEKTNAPFTDTAVAEGDKDFKKDETNYEKPSGTPYKDDAKAELDKDKKPTSNDDKGDAYSDGCKNCPKDSVANQHPSGGKATRADESRKVIKLTEEQVLAWNQSKDFMDKSNNSEIGSSEPFENQVDGKVSNQGNAPTEPIHEEENECDTNSTVPTDTPDVIAEDDFDDEDIAGFDGYDEDELPFPEVEGDHEVKIKDKDEDGVDDEDITVDNDINEDKLNDFGKHPRYQKAPMTTPPNKEVTPNDAKDWDDESAKGEEPYGKKIGSSAPFEKAVQVITDSIMESLGF